MSEYIESEFNPCDVCNYKRCSNCVLHELAMKIIRHPAADVALVRHGRWIETVQENGCAEWTEFRCSVCGAVFDGNEWLFDEWKGYPVCLTRMDGE